MSRKPAPPKPVPKKPGHVEVVRAIYAYAAQQVDELSFEEGDTLYITEKNEDGWWRARCNKKAGLIPSNYIEGNTETIVNPLHEAAKRGNLPFVDECLANRVSVNGLDKSGSTALHWAASGGHTECAQAILKVQNVELNAQNKLGDTPLHNAAWKGHADVVALLLENGANTTIRNNEKQLPYDLSAKNPEVGRLLMIRDSGGAEYGEDEDSD
ncbi:osteoclast-stimulating factor 1-like [Halichondria panicea]|uniref:osteoclast-stimulating factor 1-like n=1 Tax=Halichondria panicea TaxID=6063 RepID=UPI00312BBB6A